MTTGALLRMLAVLEPAGIRGGGDEERAALHRDRPDELTPNIDEYFQVHRPRLPSTALAGGASVGGRLWLGRLGRPLSRGIERQIIERTTEAFGKPIYPHLFRDIAVTELVEEFVAAYHEEVNRHRRDATAARAGKERELVAGASSRD